MKMITVKKFHVKLGDRVKIIAGDNKGTIGNISFLNREKKIALLDSLENNKENSKKKVRPIHISNLMLWDSSINIASRVGIKIVENKKKRYFKKSGNIL
jgi:large subunit ribosomal protein L24